jgi:5-methylcytosine-specific restriction endonuclease McrA
MEAASKTCSKCGEVKPATTEYFFRKRDGTRPDCKVCTSKSVRDYDARNRERINERARAAHAANREHRLEKRRILREARRNMRPVLPPKTEITCTKCNETKPATLEFYYSRKDKRNGLSAICRVCKDKRDRAYHAANRTERNQASRAYRASHQKELLEYNRAWHRANKEYSNERNRKWRSANPERKAEMARLWRDANKETLAERGRAYRAANRERLNEQSRLYYKANPQMRRAGWQRRRAREMQAEGSFNGHDIQRQYKAQRGKCYYCSAKVGENYHVDHVVPLTRGGSNDPSNLVIACPSCNQSKNNKLPHEWPQGGRLL